MGKIIDVEYSKLKDEFDIRCILDTDRIVYLAELIRAGQILPPIKITPDFKIIDGRHRKEAYFLEDILTIKAEVLNVTGTIDIVKEALSSNMGGALPPLKNDLLRTMTILINKGYSRTRILKEFESIIPLSLLKSSHHHALWAINRKKVNNAVDLIRDGLTIEKACEATGASIQSVRDKLNPKDPPHNHVALTLKRMFSHFDKKLGKVFSKILEDFEDGNRTKGETENVIKGLSKLIINQNRMYANWEKRWNYKK